MNKAKNAARRTLVVFVFLLVTTMIAKLCFALHWVIPGLAFMTMSLLATPVVSFGAATIFFYLLEALTFNIRASLRRKAGFDDPPPSFEWPLMRWWAR
ncbi:MAG: hypothetical protein BWY68_00327 [bacterium ADurb.Bin400]|nr:MAG: hypothetical protein BWY68_00327 [bacterium ADurb.Bin400]